ncbi:hypothetical protein Hanom_Chr02g00098971 [Helianthus anomalus]
MPLQSKKIMPVKNVEDGTGARRYLFGLKWHVSKMLRTELAQFFFGLKWHFPPNQRDENGS